MSIRIKIEDLPRVLAEDNRQLKKQVLESVHATARNGKTLLQTKTPVSFGTLRASWDTEFSGIGATIKNDAPYAATIEGGATPHGVSRRGIDNIIFWAMQKFGITSDEAKDVAFGIAKKIQKQGQRGTFFVRNSLPELKVLFEKELKLRIFRHRGGV